MRVVWLPGEVPEAPLRQQAVHETLSLHQMYCCLCQVKHVESPQDHTRLDAFDQKPESVKIYSSDICIITLGVE